MSITVLITTYDCGEFISQAVRSIINQTYKDFELLIIDDGSADNTEEVIKSFQDNRIRFIKSTHIGRSAVLNLGLKEAKNDLISFCDADDIIHPKKIEKQIKFYKNENDLIFTDTAFFKNNKLLYELRIKNDKAVVKWKIALHGHFGPSVLYNRKFIVENGGYNENLKAFEDYDLWLRLMDKGNIINIPEILYYQRLRKDSLSTTETMKKKNLIYEIQKPYYEDLAKHFDITLMKDQLLLKGGREFFYGDKNSARKYWSKAGIKEWNVKLLTTFLLSFLPEGFLNYLKNKRIRLRLLYQLQRMFSRNDIQKEFDEVLNQLNKQ